MTLILRNLFFAFASNAEHCTLKVNDNSIYILQSQKRVEFQGRRQASYVNARRVAERLLQYTHAAHPLYQKYVRTLQNGRVDILNFRAVDADVFLCVVPLKRPIRPSTFTVSYVAFLFLLQFSTELLSDRKIIHYSHSP